MGIFLGRNQWRSGGGVGWSEGEGFDEQELSRSTSMVDPAIYSNQLYIVSIYRPPISYCIPYCPILSPCKSGQRGFVEKGP